jgi:hypothetical protein
VTKNTEQEFLRLVVPGSTTAWWLWSGQHDQGLRPIFRGEKAYQVMYQLRNGDIPTGCQEPYKFRPVKDMCGQFLKSIQFY